MQQVIAELTTRGIEVSDLAALELFGGRGTFHTRDYASHVASLDVWEVEPSLEGSLKHNLPGARVKITDSFQEARTTDDRYSMIVIDNPLRVFNGYCEHFELFPDVFRIATDRCILILDVLPNASARVRQHNQGLFDKAHLARRREFYQTDHPEQLSVHEMVEFYVKLVHDSGFGLVWWFTRQRTSYLHYLVFCLERQVAPL